MELQDILLSLHFCALSHPFWVFLASGSLSTVCPGGTIKMQLVLIFLHVVLLIIRDMHGAGSSVSLTHDLSCFSRTKWMLVCPLQL